MPESERYLSLLEWAQSIVDICKGVDEMMRSKDRQIATLERVIRDEIDPSDCADELNRQVVEAVIDGDELPETH